MIFIPLKLSALIALFGGTWIVVILRRLPADIEEFRAAKDGWTDRIVIGGLWQKPMAWMTPTTCGMGNCSLSPHPNSASRWNLGLLPLNGHDFDEQKVSLTPLIN